MSWLRARNQKLLSSILASFAKYSGLNPLSGGVSVKHSASFCEIGRYRHCGHSQVSFSKQHAHARQRFMFHLILQPFMKGVSYACDFPAEFLLRPANWIVADVRWSVEVIGELQRHSCPFESEHGIQASAKKIRVYRCQGAVHDVERMFYLQCRRLFPHGVTGNFAVDLGD